MVHVIHELLYLPPRSSQLLDDLVLCKSYRLNADLIQGPRCPIFAMPRQLVSLFPSVITANISWNLPDRILARLIPTANHTSISLVPSTVVRQLCACQLR